MSRTRPRAADLDHSWHHVTAESDESTDHTEAMNSSTHAHAHAHAQRHSKFSPGRASDKRAPISSSHRQPDYDSDTDRDFGDTGLVMPIMHDSRVHASRSSARPIDEPPRPRRANATTTPKSYKTRPTRRQPADGVTPIGFVWNQLLGPVLSYILSTVAMAFDYARPLLALALLTYCIYALWTTIKTGMTASLYTAISPVCLIPGASHMIPFCPRLKNTTSTPPLEFSNLVQAQSSFEDVLLASADSASLPRDMKRSETSIRDLKSIVEYSNLPSRHELVLEFQGFAETARQASDDLTRYNTRIAKAVDRILSTNKWTLQVLDGIAETQASRGHVVRFIQDRLNPFAPLLASSSSSLTQTLLFDQYIKHTSAIEEQILELILEAQSLLRILQNLDDRLDLIASISRRDGVRIEGDQDALLAQLWTKLGGNRSERKRYAAQLALLDDVGTYRKLAIAHVSRTVLKLQAIAANLEDLRERVARPEVVGVRAELPLEMHVREIMMGVDRLEAVRDEGRIIEGRAIQKRLGLDAPS